MPARQALARRVGPLCCIAVVSKNPEMAEFCGFSVVFARFGVKAFRGAPGDDGKNYGSSGLFRCVSNFA
jgi:hypothetical protein